MQPVKYLYYLKDTPLAALQTNSTQLTIVTQKAIETYSAIPISNAAEITQSSDFQFSVSSAYVKLVVPQNYKIAESEFFPREGQQDLLLSVITDEKHYYLVVFDQCAGRIEYSSPDLRCVPRCFFYTDKVIYYVLGEKIFSWSINTVPELFYVAKGEVIDFCFAKIAFRKHMIIAEEDAVYTVDLLTGQRAFSFHMQGTPRMLMLNEFLNQVFICTNADIFFIFDLELAFSSKIRPPNIDYLETGYFEIKHVIPRNTGYLITNRESELFDVDVVYESPAAQLSDRMKMVLNYQGFTLQIKAKQRIFNQSIEIIGISKISTDYFYACTSNCAICGTVNNMEKCVDEYISLGISQKVHDMNTRLRKNLMLQNEEYLEEFINNIENYELGETSDLLDKKYKEIGKDLYFIIKAYAFPEQGEFWESITSPWEGHPEKIQTMPQEEDEAKAGLDPYYKQCLFMVMENAKSEEQDLELFTEMIHRQFSEDPIEDVRQMGLSAYVNAYLPQIGPAVWKMSQNYYLAEEKMSKFNAQMSNKQDFLKSEVLTLFSSLPELEDKTVESETALSEYIRHYYDIQHNNLETMLADRGAINRLLSTSVPMHIHNKLAFSYYERLIAVAARESARRVVDFFKQNGVTDLITPGQNPVLETISEELSINTEYREFYEIIERFEIGKGELELFAIMPNNINQIELHVETFVDQYAERLRYVDQCIKAMRTIDTKTLPFEQKIMFYEVYDMLEVNSCTELLFMANNVLKNSVDSLHQAILLANELNKGSFQFLSLYDVRELNVGANRIKVLFHYPSEVFRLSDIFNHVCQDLVWLNPRNKSWLDNQYIAAALKKSPIGMAEIKKIIENLIKAASFVRSEDILTSAFSPKDIRVIGYLDPTTVFININSLEVHLPYLFEPFRDFNYLKGKIVDGVCYKAPELLFGAPQDTSDVYSIAMLFIAMYHSFVFVPKQKAAKKKDIRPLQLYVSNIPHFIQLTEQLEAENLQIYEEERVKNPPNEQEFLPEGQSRFLMSLIRSEASLCMDVSNIPQEAFSTEIISYMLRGDKESLKAAEFYLSLSIFEPFANAQKQQEKTSHSLFETNKQRYQKFTELMEKSLQQFLKKCFVFNAEGRLSVDDFANEWKCDEIDRSLAEEKAEGPADQAQLVELNEKAVELKFPEIRPSPSGEDLSDSSVLQEDEDSSEDFGVETIIDEIRAEADGNEEVEEELPEEEKKEQQQEQQKSLEIEAFKEMYEEQFGILPNDMDLDELLAENCVDFELPEEEKVRIDLDYHAEHSESRDFFVEAAENPEKFAVEEPISTEDDELKPSKSVISSVINAMQTSKSVYDEMPEEEIEEFEIPEDFEEEGKEELDMSEEKNWFEIAAEEERKEQERLATEKRQKKALKLAQKAASGECEEEYEEEEYEEEEETNQSESENGADEGENEAYSEQHVNSKSDRPIWALDSEESDGAVQNGEVEDSSSDVGSVGSGGSAAADETGSEASENDAEHETMFDEDGRAFWFDDNGEMHYIE